MLRRGRATISGPCPDPIARVRHVREAPAPTIRDGEQITMETHEPTAEDDSTGATAAGLPAPTPTPESHPDGLVEVAQVALKLGFTAFGGPAAHIAMLREETVIRRKWLTDAYFLDLVGATNLIPGPNSTEMVIHVGYLRAGWRGLLL